MSRKEAERRAIEEFRIIFAASVIAYEDGRSASTLTVRRNDRKRWATIAKALGRPRD